MTIQPALHAQLPARCRDLGERAGSVRKRCRCGGALCPARPPALLVRMVEMVETTLWTA